MTTAHARSVFLSSYRNMVFDQSAHVLALGYMYFLKYYSITICSVIKGSSIRKHSSRHYLWQPNSMNYYFKTEQLRNKFHTIVESFTDVEHLTIGVGIFLSFPCRTEKDNYNPKLHIACYEKCSHKQLFLVQEVKIVTTAGSNAIFLLDFERKKIILKGFVFRPSLFDKSSGEKPPQIQDGYHQSQLN